METTLWPDVDGFNPIELLHQFAYYDHPDRVRKMIEELRSIFSDENIRDEEISGLFNKEDIDHPYRVAHAMEVLRVRGQTLPVDGPKDLI